MSIPGPGDPRDDWPKRWDKDFDAVNQWAQDAALNSLVEKWKLKGTRWATILHLRVLRLRFNTKPSWAGGAGFAAKDLPGDFFDTWLVGRLSKINETLALGIGVYHLDTDWFGGLGSNWWTGGPNGYNIERRTTSELLHFLERSMDLQNASKGSFVDPEKWIWKAGFGFNDFSNLSDALTAANTPAITHDLELRWIRDAAKSDVSSVVNDKVPGRLILEITTPTMPANANDFRRRP